MTGDTIFALSTGALPSAVAIIRLSGPAAVDALSRLIGDAARLPRPRRASLRPLKGADGALLEEALVLLFPGPNSFTGEDVVDVLGVIGIVEAGL